MVTTRMMAFGTLSAIVLSSTPSLAAEIRATASPDGYLLVEGTQLLSDACLSLDDVRQGSPEGAAEISNAQAFTLRISHSGDDMCAQVVSEAPFSVRVRDDRYRPFVILYREYEGFPAHLPANVSRTWGEISAKGVLE